MSWLARTTIVPLAVAGLLSGSALVAAQARKAEDPAQPAEAKTTTTVTIKVEQAPAGKSDRPVQKEATKLDTVGVKAVEVKKEAAKPAVAQKRAGNFPQNIEPQAQQFANQLRPMLRAEVHLAFTACAPTTKEQRAAILAGAEAVLKDVSRQCAEGQMMPRKADVGMPNPQRLMAAGIAALLKDRVADDQLARYRAESAAKDEAFRRVAVGNLVANIDDELLLSADQRGRLVQALESHWKDAWCSSLQSLLHGSQYLPMITDDVIGPILDPTQKQVWGKKQKYPNMFWGNFGGMGNAMLEEEPDAKAKAEPKGPDAKAEVRPAEAIPK